MKKELGALLCALSLTLTPVSIEARRNDKHEERKHEQRTERDEVGDFSDPFAGMRNMFDMFSMFSQLNDFPGQRRSLSRLDYSMKEYPDKNELVVTVRCGDFKKEELTIVPDEETNSLSIRAQHSEQTETESDPAEKNVIIHREHRSFSSQINTTIKIPSYANVAKAHAEFKEGVLRIVIPTTPEKAKPLTIKIT